MLLFKVIRRKWTKIIRYQSPQNSFSTRKNCDVSINPDARGFIDNLYNEWTADPNSVHPSWAKFFTECLGNVESNQQQYQPTNKTSGVDAIRDQEVVDSLVKCYQNVGYMAADLDPLGLTNVEHERAAQKEKWKKDSGFYSRGFDKPERMKETFLLPKDTFFGSEQMTLEDILKKCEEVYTKHIGVEFQYIGDNEKVRWLKEHLEKPGTFSITKEHKTRIWERLAKTTLFEDFLARKWPSERRFGIEGCDMMIPALKEIIDNSTAYGVECFNIGMAHRGRLNTLVNVCEKPLYQLFVHFIGLKPDMESAGDVKYHLGTSVQMKNEVHDKMIQINLIANASHLEHVNPVVLGKCRAVQFFSKDSKGDKSMPILIHGDSSFAGQGIVFETIQLADLSFFSTKGTIHFIVNNQIGFTTEPRFYKSGTTCADVSRVINAPVFHVNAEDPEAVCLVCRIASEWRKKFRKCIVIDLIGYRRHGHNEADEPAFTQPQMYSKIRARQPLLQDFTKKMVAEGLITDQRVKEYSDEYQKVLEEALEKAKKESEIKLSDWIDSKWKGFFKNKDKYEMKSTGLDESTLKSIGLAFSTPPALNKKFVVHKALLRILKNREELVNKRMIDWALGEALALGSLLKEGNHVQFTGQDVERGTFSHRHHIIHNQDTEPLAYNPLNNLYPDQAEYLVCNSSLSENAVLGFQLGYSTHDPHCLTIWEAQFGDFANTAQTIIDQFITSGQSKWLRQTGLMMLLPHGMEGMGSEHSSGRIERFLNLCDDDPDTIPPLDDPQFRMKQLYQNNIILANVSTAANVFHIWRRQLYMNFRKPCIIFSPKAILRLPETRSKFEEILKGTFFQPVYPDNEVGDGKPKRVIFCSGKIYYELKKERENRKLDKEIALVRIEQICPFPYDLVLKELKKYPDSEIVWAQEEHKYQGAAEFVRQRLLFLLENKKDVRYIGRPVFPCTATNLKYIHAKELENIINETMKL